MAYPDDPRRTEAQAMGIDDVMVRLELQGLKRAGPEWIGPCPQCGGDDRFAINTRKGVFGCRRCGAKGGGIDLVMFVLGLDFPGALTWLCGPATGISAEERQARSARARANADRKAAEAERYRAKAISDARRVWTEGRAPEGTPVRDYLTLRGIKPELFDRLPVCLRYHPDLPLMVQIEGEWQQLHRGPAMLAAVQGPDDRFCAVHRTWIDLDQPKGKPVLLHPVTGKGVPAKKLLGSKKGGTIRLAAGEGDTLIMGEGIETTLSSRIADMVPGATYWAGVDLGNMAGLRAPGDREGIPDLTDREAFLPPPWVRRLIFIQDGDSDATSTRAKLLSGLRRAMALRPGLRGQIVHAGKGVDLNDVLLGETTE